MAAKYGNNNLGTISIGHHITDDKSKLCGHFTKYSDIVKGKHNLIPDGQLLDLCNTLFRHQFFRLCSFDLEQHAFETYSTVRLAEEGFYKAPSSGEIQCFSCGFQHNVLRDGGDPHRRHRSEQRCLHAQGRDERNVTLNRNGSVQNTSNLGTDFVKENETANILPRANHHNMAGLNTNRSQVNERNADEQSSRLHAGSSGTGPRGSHRSGQETNLVREFARNNEIYARDHVRDKRKRNLHRKVALTDYRYELCRLQSYSRWPSNAAVCPEDLANAGFYYMGDNDRVQCVFCRGILRCWEAGDKALAEHLRHFPMCPYLTDPQSTGNVPLGDEEESLFNTIQMRNCDRSDDSSGAAIASVVSNTPLHPSKAHISTRLASFQDFPSNAYQKPEDLAKAGFFYTGDIDRVCCFFCNVMISNWKPTADPWSLHAVKSESCGYVLITKGKQFIEQIKQNINRPNRMEYANGRKKLKANAKHHVSAEKLEEAMSSATVRTVSQNYDLTLVKSVIKRRLQELGETFPNAESLIDAILEYEEESEEDLSDDEEVPTKDDEEDRSAEGPATLKDHGYARKDTDHIFRNTQDMNDADNIQDEASLLQQREELLEESRCKVCLDERASIVFLKCGHMVCCHNCAPALTKCPICREKILGTIRVDL